MCLIQYANNKGADQPAHPCSLISAFVFRCLDSIVHILAKCKISRLYLISVGEQASLSLTCSQPPEDTFSHDEAQIYIPVLLELAQQYKCHVCLNFITEKEFDVCLFFN